MKKGLVDLGPQVDRAFAILAFTVNRHLMEHMRRIALDLGMDFESAYIYGVLAHLNVAPALSPGCRPNDVLNEAGRSKFELTPVRLIDVSQVSGLPRETVRRKLEQLQKSGKVERMADGLWQLNQSGIDGQVYAFTKETILRFFKTADDMHATLSRLEPNK